MRKKIVAANWKMNGRLDLVFKLLEPLVSQPIDGVEIVIFPPSTYLLPAASALTGSRVQLGAQNLSDQLDGAFTGEISAEMVLDCGASHVLVGHSERRQWYGETDETVARKFERAVQAGLTPVLCIGETQAQHQAGETEQVIAGQLQPVFDLLGRTALEHAIVAYEPVWAIGTGLTATPEQAQSVHAFIRRFVAKHDESRAKLLPVLYGGSVKADNAASLFAQPDVDGGLVGGASLDSDGFKAICQAAI